MASPISEHMTPRPHSVGQEQNLAKAAQFMREHRFRHLPVLHGGELVGVLSDRDIVLIENIEHLNPEQITVEDAMSSPYTVSPDTDISDVLAHMAEHRLGSAVIVDGNEVAGIYTSTDAVRMLAKHLK